MRNAKDRTIEKKRRNKTTKVLKTETSRRKRIANKHRREEIHAIDPNMKVIVKDQRTFDQYGTEVEVIDGKIKPVLINGIYKLDVEPIVEEPVVENKSSFDKLLDKIRRDK